LIPGFDGAVYFKGWKGAIELQPSTIVKPDASSGKTILPQGSPQPHAVCIYLRDGQVGLLLNASPYPWLFAGERERLPLPPIGNAAGLPVAAWRLVQRITDKWLT
jgi:hypothetical protein